MSRLDGFERSALFVFTRALALVIVAVLIVGTSALVFWGASTFATSGATRVSLRELMPPEGSNEVKSTGGEQANIPQDMGLPPSIRMPFVLQKYFSGSENLGVLHRQLDELTTSEQQEYLDNLAEIVSAQEVSTPDATAVINRYFTVKDSRIQKAKLEAVENRNLQLYLLGSIVSAFGLIALFSLVLVLLAIERNTRTGTEATQNSAMGTSA